MSDPELVRRNVDLAFEVVFAAIADQAAADEAAVYAADGGFVLADPNDADLSLANEAMVERLRARGERVVLLEVQKKVTLQAH